MTIPDLSVVRTKREQKTVFDVIIPENSRGTVIHVYASGHHYEVEFQIEGIWFNDAFEESDLIVEEDGGKTGQ